MTAVDVDECCLNLADVRKLFSAGKCGSKDARDGEETVIPCNAPTVT